MLSFDLEVGVVTFTYCFVAYVDLSLKWLEICCYRLNFRCGCLIVVCYGLSGFACAGLLFLAGLFGYWNYCFCC